MSILKEVLGDEEKAADRSDEPVKEKENEITTEDLIPKGIEMFVKLDRYKEIVAQLKRLQNIIDRLEELEKMHMELQELHEKFLDQLENTLGEVEEIKDRLHETLGLR